VATHKTMSESPAGFRDTVKTAARKYPRILAAGAMPAFFLFLLLYLVHTPWGMFLFLPMLLLIFSCVYVFQEAVIRSSRPLRSLKGSFRVAWGNLGVTFALWALFALIWFLIAPLPMAGVFGLGFFLPFWMVAVSVTYMDRTGELLKLEKPKEGM